MAEFAVFDDHGRKLEAITQYPDSMKDFLVEDAIAMVFQDDNAIMCLQFLQLEQVLITYNIYRLQRPARYRFVHHEQVLDLHVCLGQGFTMHHPSEDMMAVPLKSFNLRNWPEMDVMVDYEQGDTITFSICYNPEFLHKYIKFSRPVEQFLNQVDQGIHTHLSPHYSPISADMEHVINGMLYNNYEGKLKDFFLDAKAMELLNLSMRQMDLSDDNRVMTHEDIEKIRMVKQIMEQRMDDPPSIQELSRMVGSNDYLLKRHFKYYFRTTIFDHLLKFRMENALKHLRENKLSVSEIALQTGYSSLAGFSKAFKKFFGYPPSKIRGEDNT